MPAPTAGPIRAPSVHPRSAAGTRGVVGRVLWESGRAMVQGSSSADPEQEERRGVPQRGRSPHRRPLDHIVPRHDNPRVRLWLRCPRDGIHHRRGEVRRPRPERYLSDFVGRCSSLKSPGGASGAYASEGGF